ncbi:predicted protein [Verticillium alfalfae VaMs.102]|uniref:Predicted protein n=1 Tax=Verticillium alfalfae (strain VaMs.102 / ATCC MYA-4576 / FGSC 10136) TaxID=526221 RepID=C9SLL1_VERA1|nr:predicted protein [Verticillium alfalfae VaMs.102]EEY19579.1 predicted protein [Verticillium alfalfae VaMs.102]
MTPANRTMRTLAVQMHPKHQPKPQTLPVSPLLRGSQDKTPKPRAARSPTTASFPQPPAVEESTSAPPRTPMPWRWRCHACGATFRLACTRRCLCCSHVLCTERDGRGRMCRAEFDYDGWAAYGAWRRGRRGGGRSGKRVTEGMRHEVASSSSAAADDGDGNIAVEGQGCFSECDWPSQCRYRARERLVSPVTGVGMYEVAGMVEHVEVASGAAGGNVWRRGEDEEGEEDEEYEDDKEDEGDEGDEEEEEAGAFAMFIWCDGPETIDPQLLGLHGQADGHWSLAGQRCEDCIIGQDICKGTEL